MIKDIFLILFFILGLQCLLLAQDKRLISGTVVDANTKMALPYAGVSIKKPFISAIANGAGQFSISLPGEELNDTLIVKYLGYKVYFIPLSSIKNPLFIS